MKNRHVLKTACENTGRKRIMNFARSFVALQMVICALLFSHRSVAQTITVDGNPGDWPAVLASSSVAFKGYVRDPLNSHSDDTWTRGSQNTDPISGWHWTLGNTNDKTDLGNTAVALIGHNLYFCADLYADNGDASVGFWLLKGAVAPTSGGNFTGSHQEGDILVSIAFTHGHRTATPTIYKWHSGALTHVTLNPAAENAATNSSSVTAPWPYTPKSGSSGTYPANSFFEGYVNLDSVNTTFDACFSSFLFVTWESQSAHAALADLVMGNFPSPATVSLANDTVCSGSAATFTARVTGGVSPFTYSWNSAAYASASTYTIYPATTSRTITVAVRGNNGCVANASANLVVKPTPTVNPVSSACYCAGAPVSAISFSGSLSGTTYSWYASTNIGFGTSGTGNIPAFTATNTGSATITTTVTVIPTAGGCPGAPRVFTICVNPTPNVNTVSNVTLCDGVPGAPITFSGRVAGTSFSWTATSNLGFGTSGTGNIGWYTAHGCTTVMTNTVTVTSTANGCPGSSTSFVVTVNPNPTVTATGATVCCGHSISLTGSPAGGTWSGACMSGSAFNAAGLAAGVYTVTYTYTNSSGCTGTATASVTVTDCHGGKGSAAPVTSGNTSYKVYPNPSEGIFTIDIPAVKTEAEIIVMDLYGKVVEKQTVGQNDNMQQVQMNLGKASKGIYYLRVNNGDDHYTDKILLK